MSNRSTWRKAAFVFSVLFTALVFWTCNVSDPQHTQLNVKLADSLAVEAGKYDTIQIDIYSADGSSLLVPKAFVGEYHQNQNGQISGIDLGTGIPENFTIQVTGYKDKVKKLVYTITVKGSLSDSAVVIFVLRDTSSIPPQGDKPSSVVIADPKALTLMENAAPVQISAKALPSGASQILEWKSSDTAVATVDASGKVSPLRPGPALIVVSSKADATKKDTLTLTVIKSVAITGITISPESILLYTGGKTETLTAKLSPSTANLGLAFYSSDTAIVKVSETGIATAVAPGSALIFVNPSGMPSLTDMCTVVVKKDVPVLAAGNDRQTKPGVAVTFNVTVTQEYGTIVVLKWDLNGDNVYEDSTTAATASPSFAYPTEKEYQAKFYVRDGEGNVATLTRRVVVGNQPFVDITTPSGLDTLVNTPAFKLVYTIDTVKSAKDTVLKEGKNPIVISSTNGSGTGKDSVLITLDTTPPGVPSFDSAATTASPTNNKRPTWKWKTGGNGGMGIYKYQLGSNAAVTGTATSFAPAADLADSTYTLTVSERDSAGNWSANATHSIQIKTNGPSAPLFDSAGTTVSPTSNKKPTWKWKSGGGGNGTFKYQFAGSAAVTGPATSFTPAADLADSTYTLTVAEQDAAGNWSANATRSIQVKTSGPAAPIFDLAVTTTSPTNNKRPTWKWKTGGGGNGTFKYQLSGNAAVTGTATSFTPAADLADSTYTLTVAEQDVAGNWSANATKSIQVKTAAPSTPAFVDSATTVSPTRTKAPVWAWKSGAGGAGAFRYRLDNGPAVDTTGSKYTGSNLADGNHTLKVIEKDAAGNWSDTATRSIFVKSGAPLAPNLTVSAAISNAPKWSWTGGGGGDGTFRYKLDAAAYPAAGATDLSYTPTTIADGLHTLCVEETDVIGWGAEKCADITVDKTNPSAPTFLTTGTPSTTPSPTRTTTPTWAWTGGGGGNGTFRYQLGAGSVMTGTATSYTSTALTDGSYTLTVAEKDAAGNWSANAPNTIVIKASAPLAPNLTATASIAKSPQWNWTGAGGGNGTFRTKLDAAAYPTTGSTAKTSSPTGLTDGAHTLCVQEQDAVGWGAEKCLAITVDNTAPALAITSSIDPNLMITSVNPTISGTASDANFESVSYTLNGTTTPLTRTGNNWSFTASYPDGDWTVTLTAKDLAGGQNTASVVVHKRSNVIFVRQTISTSGDGTSWAKAYKELSSVMDGTRTFANKRIWVSEGSYTPNPSPNMFYADNSAALIGGFKADGSQYSESQRTPSLNQSLLTGPSNPTLVIAKVASGSWDPTSGFFLDGFTISNQVSSGGIYTSQSTNLTIRQCKFLNFTSDIPLYITGEGTGTTVRVINSRFTGNNLSDYAPIHISSAAVTIDSGSYFENNTSSGGAVSAYSGSIFARNSTFKNDKVIGGELTEMYLGSSVTLDIANCGVTGLRAGISGGDVTWGSGNTTP